jgi:tetratricopeptide (TPR) repeat protein
VAGPESFLDHVHPQSELHLQLAYEIARVLHAGNPSRFPAPELTNQNMAEVRAASIGVSSPAVEAMALCNLAQTLTWAGKVAESLPLAEQASALDPTNVWIICQYGRLLDKSGKRDDSRKTYERALKIDRRDPMSNYRLGMMCLEDGDPVAALPLLETARQNMPAGAPLAYRSGLQQALRKANRQLGRPIR